MAVATVSFAAASAGGVARRTMKQRGATSQAAPIPAKPTAPCDCEALWTCLTAGDGRDCSGLQRSLDNCLSTALRAE
jgi:hypothetical protein